MKKTVALAAAATMVLGLAACSKSEEANTANVAENAVEENLTSENVVDVANETANATDNAATATENAANATDANASNEAAK